jgi:hypothetical protein
MMKLEPGDGLEHVWQDVVRFSHLCGVRSHPTLTAVFALDLKIVTRTTALTDVLVNCR